MNEDVEVARGYHERTKHSEERLRANAHQLDWAILGSVQTPAEAFELVLNLSAGTAENGHPSSS